MFCLAPAAASAQNTCGPLPVAGELRPSVLVCVNGVRYNFDVSVDGKFGFLRTTTISLGTGASFTVGARFNSDPFTNFTFSSTIPGGFGNVNFDLYFTTPVIGGPYNSALSNYTSSLTLTSAIGGGASSGSIFSGSYPAYFSGTTNLGSLGVDVGSATCTVSTASTFVCPPGSKTNSFAPITPSALNARLSYAQGTQGVGASSTADWAGGVEITNATTTVPEPSIVAMLAIGLLALGGVARQRRAPV